MIHQLGMIIPSPASSYCGKTDEFLEHIFVTCPYTKKFRADFIKWISNQDIEIRPLYNKDIKFSLMDRTEIRFNSKP